MVRRPRDLVRVSMPVCVRACMACARIHAHTRVYVTCVRMHGVCADVWGVRVRMRGPARDTHAAAARDASRVLCVLTPTHRL